MNTVSANDRNLLKNLIAQAKDAVAPQNRFRAALNALTAGSIQKPTEPRTQIMKNHSCRTSAIWLLAIISGLLLGASPVAAQNEVKSTDLSQALKVFLESMSAAQSSEQAAHAKAAELIKAADGAAAQFQNTNLPPQARFEAHAKAIKLKTQAVCTQLAAARQNTKLLAGARSALRDISRDLGSDLPEDLKDLPRQEDQPKVDAALGNLNLPEDASIAPESADALAAARGFYDLACKGAVQGAAGSTTLQTVARRLTAWEAKNRRTVVLADARLRQLQLGAVSGLTSVGDYTLNQALGEAGELALPSVAFGDPLLAPEISSKGETASPWPAKVSLRRALAR